MDRVNTERTRTAERNYRLLSRLQDETCCAVALDDNAPRALLGGTVKYVSAAQVRFSQLQEKCNSVEVRLSIAAAEGATASPLPQPPEALPLRRAPRMFPELEGPSRAGLALEYPMPFCSQTTCVNGLTAAPPDTDKFCQERGNLLCLSSGMPSSIRACEASSESQPVFGKEEDTEDRNSRSLSTSTRCTSVCSESDSADSIGSEDKLAYQHDPFEPMYVTVRSTSVDYPVSRPPSVDDFFNDINLRCGELRGVIAPASGVVSICERASGIGGPTSGQVLAASSEATSAFGAGSRTGENLTAKGSEGPDLQILLAASGTIREAKILGIGDSIFAPVLGSPEQPTVGSDISTVLEQSTVSTEGSPLNVGERAKRARQARPSKLQRLHAKRLADREFRMQLSSRVEGEEADSKLFSRISNDPMAAKYACAVLRALNREAHERIANGEDPAGTAARF